MTSAIHPDLHGRVALVTGASRGIGKALAVRLAQEGADVAVLAKSEQSTERLPGSIHETADAVRALGRRAVALAADVRDDEAVRAAIERTVAELGRLDILVNNAGAIWTQPILQTPPKRFDLMMGVNVRAAYVACHYALPHMVRQRWGHILNMCPRLSLDPKPGKVAYMISKLGMAQLAIGLAAEHCRRQCRRQHPLAADDHRKPGVDQLEYVRPVAMADPGDPLRRRLRHLRAGAEYLHGASALLMKKHLASWLRFATSMRTGARASLRAIRSTSIGGNPECGKRTPGCKQHLQCPKT